MMGILSYHAIGASQFGQKLRFGFTKLMWLGTRQITTFRNDPKMQPITSDATSSSTTVGVSFTMLMFTSISRSAHHAIVDGFSSLDVT